MDRQQYGELLIAREELSAEITALKSALRDQAIKLQDMSAWVLRAIGEEQVDCLPPASAVRWRDMPEPEQMRNSLSRLVEICTRLREVQSAIDRSKQIGVGR